MIIGILGAMEEEIAPLLDYFKTHETEHIQYIECVEYADNKYHRVKYKNLDLVIAHSKIGKVFSSLTASVLIQHFKCDQLIFTGVAGAINKSFQIGDIIVADRLCQHDVDITAFGHPFGYIPSGQVYYEASKSLLKIAREVAEQSKINLKTGIIATGDQFVASSEKKKFISETFHADALEMEGAAVAVVCSAFKIPFLILRSISDTAESKAELDFDAFLAKTAYDNAQFVIKIIDKL